MTINNCININDIDASTIADEGNGLRIVSIDKYRGPIYALNDDKYNLIFRGFPTSSEYTEDSIGSVVDIDPSKCIVYPCAEGTVIRVFYYGDKWYTSTTRRLDAFKSRWASKTVTFGQSFADRLRKYLIDDDIIESIDKDFLDVFYSRYLDKDKRYLFFLRSSGEERIVCDNDDDDFDVWYIGQERQDYTIDFDDTSISVIPKIDRLTNLLTLEDVAEYVRNEIDYRRHQGIIMFRWNDENNELESIKVMSTSYAERYAVRNNVPSLKFRYLQLRNDPYRLELFLDTYPSMVDIAKNIEEDIYQGVCKSLHMLYMNRYIENRLNVECTKEEIFALRLIHKQYTLTRQRTTPTRINDILTREAPATILNKLLRSYRRSLRNHHDHVVKL